MTSTDGIADLIKLSRYAGERFDLVQAGGGNSSLKSDDHRMWIKRSGISLSDVASQQQFCLVDWVDIVDFLAQAASETGSTSKEVLSEAADAVMKKSTISTEGRPSIETFLHAMLGPYTLHTHPIAVTSIVCTPGWRETIEAQFTDAITVDYFTPGIDLALALLTALKERKWQAGSPARIFLGNHGFIAAAGTATEVMKITDETVHALAKLSGMKCDHYQLVNRLSELLQLSTGSSSCVYMTEDAALLKALKENIETVKALPSVPDQAVYCGKAPLVLSSLESPDPIVQYQRLHGRSPQVIVLESGPQNQIFFAAKNRASCRDVEEVFKAHVLSLMSMKGQPIVLPEEEIGHLLNWEAEKYRQKL